MPRGVGGEGPEGAEGVGASCIAPGALWENGCNESLNTRFHDELLDRQLFTSLGKARVLVEDDRLQYNHRRPHSSLDYLMPVTFAARQRSGGSAPPAEAGQGTDKELKTDSDGN